MSKLSQALDAVLKYGTPLQREIVTRIRKSSLAWVRESIGGSGAAGIIDTAATQKRINSEIINETQAFDEIRIKINPITEASNVGLEGTIVHETRHAYHQARAISEFSQAHKLNRPPYNPDGYVIEFAAHHAYGDYVLQCVRLNHPDKQAFINESISLGVTHWVNGKLEISINGINNRLSNSYGVDYKNRGKTFSDHWGLTPRSK